MERKVFQEIERYMNLCMQDSAHDKEHVRRVLYNALDIAGYEKNVDYEVLITACLLHDIGRKEQFENPRLCHARVGSDKAYGYLKSLGWQEKKAVHVRECILTHRFRADNEPQSIEAKILFDADKLDVTGAVGIARTLMYNGEENEPMYTVLQDGSVSDGKGKEPPSFFREYQFKLKKIHKKMYTRRGKEVAQERRNTAKMFYKAMLGEVRECYSNGEEILDDLLD